MGDTVVVDDDKMQLRELPVALAFDTAGNVVPVTAEVDPLDCDHAGAGCSSSLDIRCPRCGARLFIPGRFLANQCRLTIDMMYLMWEEAGFPEWFMGGWNVTAEYWTIVQDELFEATGGLPVLNRRLEAWRARWPTS